MSFEPLKAENIDETIQGHEIVVIHFWEPETPACDAFTPLLEAAAASRPSACFVSCNVAEESELAEMFKIKALPTLVVFREQVLVFGQEGVLTTEQLGDLFSKVDALDMKDVKKRILAQEAQLPLR